MNQIRRNRLAIATVLRQMGRATYQDIALRAGERLAGPVMEMVRDGEVERIEPAAGEAAQYRLTAKGEIAHGAASETSA